VLNVKGFVVASGESGTRQVLASSVRARGVFNGVGKIVETENLPGDPDNASRDDLVFAEGSLHIISLTLDAKINVDPESCVVTVELQQATTIEGGTGLFANASGNAVGKVSGFGLAQRAADGSCDPTQAPRFEVDQIAGTGTLSY
jgi:hypothetical protein